MQRNESLYYTHKKYYLIWSRPFFKNIAQQLAAVMSGAGNFCALSG